jgi:hypothetical protein
LSEKREKCVKGERKKEKVIAREREREEKDENNV